MEGMAGEDLDRVLALLAPVCDDDLRKSAITAAHVAIGVIVRAVVEPFMLDGLLIDTAPHQVGFTSADGALDSLVVWAADVPIEPCDDPTSPGVKHPGSGGGSNP